MTALEAYKSYGGKRTNQVFIASTCTGATLSVNGDRFDSIWRSMAETDRGIPNQVVFRRIGKPSLVVPETETVTLGE
jgi:hypothetical protein